MPAQSTYNPIATVSISGSSTSTISFTSIPQTYTDLFCIVNGRNSYAPITVSQIIPQFNIDGTGNYSYTILRANGSTTTSARSNNSNFTYGGSLSSAGAPANIFGSCYFHILNYSNTTTFKNLLCRSSADLNGSGELDVAISTWRNTAAINAVTFGQSFGTAYVAGTTATLYGITAA
jgi:hypothetical protein